MNLLKFSTLRRQRSKSLVRSRAQHWRDALRSAIDCDHIDRGLAIRRAAVRMAVVEGRAMKLRRVRRIGLFVFALLMYVVPYALSVRMASPLLKELGVESFGMTDMLAMLFTCLLSTFVIISPVYLPESFINALELDGWVLAWIASLALVGAGVGWALIETETGIALGLLESVGMLALVVIWGLINGRILHRIENRYPELVLIRELVSALNGTRHTRQWLELQARRETAMHLHTAARIVRKSLWRRMETGDASTRFWLKEMCEHVSQNLKALERAVVWPMGDTRDFVARELRRLNTCIVTGNWTALTAITYPQYIPPAARLHVRTLLPHIFFAAAPLLMLMLLSTTETKFPAGIAEYIALGAYAWAVIGILTAFDPLVEKRLSAIRTTLSLFKAKPE
jgi:hypothetical protein